MHPPQVLNIRSYDDKILDPNRLHFTLVGANFFSKGGKEILAVFDRLLAEGKPVFLNIISTMQYGDYASQTSKSDLDTALRLIAKHPKGIKHRRRVSNKQVMNLFNQTHIGLLPSLGETYGYTVLEAQGSGCPVISTDIRALPEINDSNVGWLIDVPKDEWKNGKLGSKEERFLFSNLVIERLYEIILEIIENREVVKKLGTACLGRIKKGHDPENRAFQMEEVYDALLG